MNRNDIINKKFSHSFTGYDISEVDLFLDEIIREFDRKNNEKGLLEFRIEHELNVALKYIRFLRHQLKAAGIEPLEVPISILDDLKELTEEADALDETAKAEDAALLKSVQEAIEASDRLCSEGENETSEKSEAAEIPDKTENAAGIEAVPTADDESCGKETAEETENTAETEAVPTLGTENFFIEVNEDSDETPVKAGKPKEPSAKSAETLSLGKCVVINETPTEDSPEFDSGSPEAEENPKGKGKYKKKPAKKRRPKGAKAKKKTEFEDYEEYNETEN